MGQSCVSESKKLCQNDIQTSTNIQNQPIKMVSEIISQPDLEISNLRQIKKSNINLNSRNNCETKQEQQEECIAKNEDLIEFESVGEVPKLYIQSMRDIKIVQTKYLDFGSQNFSQNKLMQSTDMNQQQSNQHSILSKSKMKKILVQQYFKVTKKPSLGYIIKHVQIEPLDNLIFSYNIKKNEKEILNINKSKISLDKQSNIQHNYSSYYYVKKKKITLLLNQHQVQDQDFIINTLQQQKLYHLSIKLYHQRHQNLLDKILSQLQSQKFSLKILNVDYHIKPYQIPSLQIFKIDLEGYNCSTNNFGLQESLFFFYCCNSSTIQSLKIKARKCSVSHFFTLLESDILSQNPSTLKKISLDLIFFGQFQNDIYLLQSFEKVIREAIFIQKWNISFKFKENTVYEAAAEFDKNSHFSMCESYLITQQKDSFLHNKIDQSSFLSPIIKHKEGSPKQNMKLFNNVEAKQKSQSSSLQNVDVSSKLNTPQPRKPSNFKKNSKSNTSLGQNKPVLMLMQELKQTNNQQIEPSIESNQELCNQSYGHIPKSPERINTVTFANNNEVPYSTIKHLEQTHHQQIVRQRNKSLFLDSSISVGIDLINEKQFEERMQELKNQFFNQILSSLKVLATKEVKKVTLHDQSAKYMIEKALPFIQQTLGLKQLKLAFTLQDDSQFYSLQNLLKNNQNTLQKLFISIEKNVIISVFDDHRLFNQLEKLSQLKILEINYQTTDFIPKYILKKKNLIFFNDLYQHKIGPNKNNPFLISNVNNNKQQQKKVTQKYLNKQDNFNQLIIYLKETSLLTFKSKQLHQNIPDSLFKVLTNHFLKRKIFFYKICLLVNYKIKNKNIIYDFLHFFI